MNIGIGLFAEPLKAKEVILSNEPIQIWLRNAKTLFESAPGMYSPEQCLWITSNGLESEIDWSIAYTWINFWQEIDL